MNKIILYILFSLLFISCTNTKKDDDIITISKNYIDGIISGEKAQDEYCTIWTIDDNGKPEPPSYKRLLKTVLKYYDQPKKNNYKQLYADEAYGLFSETRSNGFTRPVVWVYLQDSVQRPNLMLIYNIAEDSTLQYSETVLRISYPSMTTDPLARFLTIPTEPFHFDQKHVSEFYTHLYLGLGSEDFYSTAYQKSTLKEPRKEISLLLTELNEIKIDSAYKSHGYPNPETDPRYGVFQFSFEKNRSNWALYWVIKNNTNKIEPLGEYIQLQRYTTLDKVEVYLLRKELHPELISRMEEVFYANSGQQELPNSIYKVESY